MLSLVYLDLFFNSKSDVFQIQLSYIIYRKKVLFVTSEVFQMNTYAKLNDDTQLHTTTKCTYFVKINIYNQ